MSYGREGREEGKDEGGGWKGDNGGGVRKGREEAEDESRGWKGDDGGERDRERREGRGRTREEDGRGMMEGE